MGVYAEAFYFKSRKDAKEFMKYRGALELEEYKNAKGCVGHNGHYTALMSNMLYAKDYNVEPDSIQVLLRKSDVLELEPKEHWEIAERDMLLNGFDGFNAEFAFIC